MRIVARAPNHLGDGVMALPAIRALSMLGDLHIQAPRWGPELYRGVDATIAAPGVVASADLAVVFPPSLRTAWQARRARRRIGVASDHRGWLLTDRVVPGRHRRDTYGALARAAGADVSGEPAWHRRPGDPLSSLPLGHVGLNPLSVSGSVREWPRFRQLADRVDTPVFYAGPGEGGRLRPIAGRHATVVGLSLPELAAALARCAVFVSNDSGAAHFARACGVPTVVIFGSTAPDHTGPPGCIPVVGPRPACAPCGRQRCRERLGCLEVPVAEVLDALEAARG
ncbi:MAG: heptosyltransferase-2 [Myxococcota bacterium]